METKEKRVRSFLTLLLLFLSSSLGILFFAGWCLPLLFIIDPARFRSIMDFHVAAWLTYATALMEFLLKIKMVITGDEILPKERCLIIMNHRTRLDWMYLWSVLVRQSGVANEKIILKDPLKKVPGPGWAMQCAAFIFIKRSWEDDKKILKKMLDYYAALKHDTQILLFPEGTDLTEKTKARSDAFAEKNGLAKFKYVLHPRTTGFIYIMKQMRENKHLDAVYDINIAYPQNVAQNELDLLKGNFPKEVHFNVKRYSEQEIPISDEGLSQWCQKVWEEKEKNLEVFYSEKKKFPGEEKQNKSSSGGDPQTKLLVAFVFWTLFVVGILIMLWCFSIFRWIALGQSLFYFYITYKGGFEVFQADLVKKSEKIVKLS